MEKLDYRNPASLALRMAKSGLKRKLLTVKSKEDCTPEELAYAERLRERLETVLQRIEARRGIPQSE